MVAVLIKPGAEAFHVCHRDGSGEETVVASIPRPDPGHPDLSTYIDREIADGNTRFIIDITQARWISSAGVGWLLQVSKRVRDHGGRCALVVTERQRETLEIGVRLPFEIYESIDGAVRELE